MCGIVGIISRQPVSAAVLTSMTDRIRHRGPDDEGRWIDASGLVGFSHRRLSIVDLSPAGHQPMHSADGRFTLSYNGEIYNHAELRHELDRQFGPLAWRGHSDTETLLEGIARWGLEAALERAVGMFAISLWDAKGRRLYLVRDRFGEKPLYFGWVGGDFAFASDLVAIRRHPGFDNPIDRQALRRYAARGYVPAPFSIFQRIYKLSPGCILSASINVPDAVETEPPRVGHRGRDLEINSYWSYRQTVLDGLADPINDERAAIDQLEAVLAQAVQGQSIADVPVGAFLSGGIDSSTVVALYQKYSAQPVRTFTIGFDDPAYDEAPAARAVAGHFGTQHHELYVTAEDARDVIPKLASIYGEPFADSSQIPTYLISAFARTQVKVALSGDGGDELFGGYNRYLGLAGAWRRLEKLGGPVRAVAGGALGAVPSGLWHGLARARGHSPQPEYGGKIRKSFRAMGQAKNTEDLLDSFLDEWWQVGEPVAAAGKQDLARIEPDLPAGLPPALRMMVHDALSYLPDDILCKVDRASMAVSLESRVPYLDHRVAALAGRIPLGLKIRRGQGKHILRQLLYRQAPRELFDRPKAGFAIPVGSWIKGPLRPWAEELLDPARMHSEGWFDAELIHRRWRDHLSGRRDSTAAIWSILMFQAWLREEKGVLALAA